MMRQRRSASVTDVSWISTLSSLIWRYNDAIKLHYAYPLKKAPSPCVK
jgi:hypothetical protein